MVRTDPAATWLDVLGEAARRRPGAVAFDYLADGEDGAAGLTYAGLDRGARRVAAYLQAEGMAGERIVLWYPSGLDYLVAFFGCLYAGAVAVPAYPPTRRRRSAERVLAILRDAAPACALTTAAVRDRLPADLLVGGRPPVATDTLPAELADAWADPGAGPGTVAFLQYTSGSTGTPRGVILTHRNLLANSAMIHELFGTSERTRAVSWLPMYHDMGLIGSILQVLYCGGTSTLMSPVAFVQDPFRWLRAISRTRATASGGPNFAYDLCVERITPEQRATLDLSSWELAFNGAEPIRARTLHRFADTFAECGFRAEAMTSCYGLAEATLLVSARKVGSGVLTDSGGKVSSGIRPSGVRVEVVDTGTGLPCAPGGTGEIWVSGPGVGQGYWNREQESAGTFRAELADAPGVPFLRTGDLGHLAGDGELYVTGRAKDLVIVRGRNHYPQDIEQTVDDAQPILRTGCAAAFPVTVDGAEELAIVAEVGPREMDGDLPGAARRIRAAVAAAHDVLPHAVALIRAGELRKTSSGKVQRGECRAAYLAGELDVLATADDPVAEAPVPEPSGAPAEAPASGEDEAPAWSVAGVLRVAGILREEIADAARVPADRVDLDQPLPAAGLDSMGLVVLQHRIATRLGVTLPLEDAFERTGGDLVELIARERARTPARPARPARPAPPAPARGPGDRPLPPGQAALWQQQQLVPDGTGQVLAMAVRIGADADAPALRRALTALADRHEALRTTFPMADGRPVARVHAALAPRLDIVDVSGWDAPALDEAVARAAHEPFDLDGGPLLRATLFRSGPGEHLLVVAVHHLVSDLWSMQIMLGELDVLYRDPDAVLPPAPAGPHASGGDPAEPLWEFWRETLAGAPTMLRLPGRPSGGAPAGRRAYGAVPLDLDEAAGAGITALAERLGVTRHAVLLAAYQVLLAQWSGARDVLVGAPAHGRDDPASAGAVGLFVNMMALRGRLAPDGTAASMVAAAHAGTRAALAHAAMPFAGLVERLRPEREPGRPPLVQAVLTWQRPAGPHAELLAALALNRPGVRAAVGGLPAETLALPEPDAQFDLQLTVADAGGRLAGRLQFDRGLLGPAAARAAADHLVRLLRLFADAPDTPLAALPAFEAPDERDAPVPADAVWHGGPLERPRRCVHDLFADQVAARPGAVAVIDGPDTLTYADLDERAERLARRLAAAGVRAGDLVALLLERSADIPVAVVAVMKAGAAYLPLDPAHPAERRDLMLDDAGPKYAIVRGGGLDRPGLTVLDLDGDRPEPGDRLAPGPVADLPGSELDRLAYVIYTSGSSGRPKGVPIGHRALANLFAATADLGFDHTDVWTLFHSYAFDFSVWELWGPLARGGTLVIVPAEATVSADAFWTLLEERRVTVLNQTPAVFREMTAGAPERLAGTSLRTVVFGGEKLEPAHLAAWRAHGDPAARLINMYGITEITVHATRTPATESGGVIPIGGPLRGTNLCLLDEDGTPVPDGEPGEICVGGAGLAWGYLGRPALTAARFVPHPLVPGGRLYRSGDLARRGPGGRLEYLGRADDQVKVRGFRIEPGEISAALTGLPGVADAVAVPVPAPEGGVRLVAYAVPSGGPDTLTPAGLRDALRGVLPAHMVPAAFVVIDEIPLTFNGKVDRRALPPAGLSAGDGAEPATGTERRVALMVAGMAGLDRVGRDDDLFDLGWHSLLMTRLAARIRAEFGLGVPLADLFARPTVRHISALVDAGGAAAARPVPAIRRVDRSRYQVTGAGLPEAMRA